MTTKIARNELKFCSNAFAQSLLWRDRADCDSHKTFPLCICIAISRLYLCIFIMWICGKAGIKTKFSSEKVILNSFSRLVIASNSQLHSRIATLSNDIEVSSEKCRRRQKCENLSFHFSITPTQSLHHKEQLWVENELVGEPAKGWQERVNFNASKIE